MKTFALVAAVSLAWAIVPARAEGIPPEKAAEMLAHAWMIDNRCNILGPEDRDALTGFVARAELALAGKTSVEAARSAIRKGRASGTSAACDEDSAATVRDTFRAVKSATAGLPANPSRPAAAIAPHRTEDRSAPPETVSKAVVAAAPASAAETPASPAPIAQAEAPKRAPRVAVNKPSKPAKPAAGSGAMAAYALTAETYYRDMRCRTRSLASAKALYAKVLRQHREAVAASGKAAVRALLRAAEARASRGSC